MNRTLADRLEAWEPDPRVQFALALACGLLLIVALPLHAAVGDSGALVAGSLSLVVGGVVPAVKTLPSVLRGRVSVDFLMLLAAAGAAYLGDVGEGAVLMLLFSSSSALESYTSRRTRRSIEALKEHIELTADRLLPDGSTEELPADALAVGDQVLIRPGARVPADGTVLAGDSSLDQAALTGESLPVPKTAGDTVLAGSINLPEGALTVRVDRTVADSTLARMVRLVEEAQESRARTQVFTDWFGERYTWLVILGAMATFAVPWAWFSQPWEQALYKAMTLLVVASPCALVLATPAAILAAISTAARHGILVKGGANLEAVARSRVVVFDKTGTLTRGEPQVRHVVTLNGVSEPEVLRLAASAELHSEHPLAAALVAEAGERGLTLSEPASFRSVTGRGVVAEVDGRQVLVGNAQLFIDEGAEVPQCPTQQCPDRANGVCRALLVGAPHPVGLVDLADTIRPDACAAVAALKAAAGVARTAMMTGDSESVAQEIAEQVGVDEVHASLLPHQKLERLEELRARHGGVIMVGDGVNDAPALAAADVGVAMGGIGSDVALETADVVLTADRLSRLPLLLALSKRATRIVAQNLVVAISVIVVMIGVVLITPPGRVPLSLAVVAHEGSTVLVILNGLRLLRM